MRTFELLSHQRINTQKGIKIKSPLYLVTQKVKSVFYMEMERETGDKAETKYRGSLDPHNKIFYISSQSFN